MNKYLRLAFLPLLAASMLFSSCGSDSDLVWAPAPPYVGITEIVPQFQLQGSTFVVGDSRDIVIRVRNTGEVYSEGSIKLYISGYSAFDINFNPTALTANTLTQEVVVQNQDCAAYKGSGFLFIETPLGIAPGEELNISITLTAVKSGQLNELSVLLENESGGDINFDNNEIFKVLTVS